MSFTTTALANGSVLVEGTDVRGVTGQQVLVPTKWVELKRKNEVSTAVAGIDAAIEALVAPITAAVEAANAVIKAPSLDPLAYVVEGKDVEHQHGSKATLVKLDADSIIVRAIEEGASDRLIWVNGSLALTSAPAQP